jgi:hypothetical protein
MPEPAQVHSCAKADEESIAGGIVPRRIAMNA